MIIFLSYSRADERAVKTLARGFEAARREVWFDHDLEGGDIWWDTILRNIRGCSVFLFALSDNSLSSKACIEEYKYACALNRPILPVLVGELTDKWANPLAQRHYVPFRPDDAVAGFEVLAAADRAAERKVPLPDPLPAEPAIPLAYLQVIRRQIDNSELDQKTQLDIVDQLRRALGEEIDRGVREVIVQILNALLAKPWRTQRTGLEIRAVLYAREDMEEEIDKASGAPTERHPRPVLEDEPPAGPPPGEPPSPQAFDPREAFLERFEKRHGEQGRPAGRRPEPEENFWERVEEISLQMQAGKAVREAGQQQEDEPAVARQHDDPPLQGFSDGKPTGGSFFAGVEQPQPSGGFFAGREPEQPDGLDESSAARTEQPPTGLPPTSEAAPPSRRALGIVGLVLSVVFGGVAVAVPVLRVLVVPFVVAAVTATVALHYSAQVGQRFRTGDRDGARSASHTAKVWGAVALTLVGTVVGFVLLQSIPLGAYGDVE